MRFNVILLLEKPDSFVMQKQQSLKQFLGSRQIIEMQMHSNSYIDLATYLRSPLPILVANNIYKILMISFFGHVIYGQTDDIRNKLYPRDNNGMFL